MKRHGWLLLFHDCMVEQLQKLRAAAERAERSDPERYESNANVKLFRVLSRLIMDTVPGDPAREEYRLGNTMGPAYRHWRRAKIGRRFRLFFRYDSRSKTIVFAWINDQRSLRKAGSKSDSYALFERMLRQGNPPTAWASLVASSRSDWSVHDEVEGYAIEHNGWSAVASRTAQPCCEVSSVAQRSTALSSSAWLTPSSSSTG